MTRETLNSRSSTGDVLERLHLDCNLEWCKNYRIIGKRPEQDCATFFISYTIVDVRLYFYWSGHKQAVLADCLIIWKDQHFVWWLLGNPNVYIAMLDRLNGARLLHHPKSPVTAVIWIPNLANSSALVQVKNWIKWRCRPPSSVKFTLWMCEAVQNNVEKHDIQSIRTRWQGRTSSGPSRESSRFVHICINKLNL